MAAASPPQGPAVHFKGLPSIVVIIHACFAQTPQERPDLIAIQQVCPGAHQQLCCVLLVRDGVI